MKVSYLLLISLLIVGALFVPAVSAYDYEETISESTVGYTYPVSSEVRTTGALNREFAQFGVRYIENCKDVILIKFNPNCKFISVPATSQSFEVEFHIDSRDGPVVGRGDYQTWRTNPSDPNGMCQIDFLEWNVDGYTGSHQIYMTKTTGTWVSNTVITTYTSNDINHQIEWQDAAPGTWGKARAILDVYYRDEFKHYYNIDEIGGNYYVNIEKNVDGKSYGSTVYLRDGDNILMDNPKHTTTDINRVLTKAPITLDIFGGNNKWYNRTFYTDTPVDPTPSQPGLRKGTVTMTDHNGTPISGFEVTAVNHYTDEEYTVSTDTDVAVMELPMDRTVEIRNPQTGVYEEAPVGYYRFYGQAPGYKMLNEEGIKVSVMPEEYGSYKLCDILVSSDSGPLTGKHQFQLRSWSDNSILQTGTISAKSRTTGIWYNETVTNGIATLVLPYDTSDALSEHAGHYYVYATSPGYEDNNYGVQISVYPRTVSEVKWIHLTPIGGVPTPDNVTLRIQAISETGQGVPNAEIFIAGVLGAGKDIWDTHIASSNGYLAVSVPGNSTYDIVARADGYYDSSRRIEVFSEDPPIIEMRLYLSGVPTIEPTTEPTGWVTGPPTTQPTGGIPDDDDGSGGFLMEAVRGIGNAFGVGFATAKIILGMLLALAIGFATAKQLRGGAAEFGLGLLGGTMLGILIGLIPVWTIVVLLLVVGLYIGNRYVGGANNG